MGTTNDPAVAGEQYAAWIARTGFAPATAALYARRAQAFLTWLASAGDEYDGALSDEHLRDYAVRDYRRHLLTEQKVAASTVEGSLSAIGSLYEWLGMARPDVVRQGGGDSFPDGLNEDELRRVLRNAQRRGVRDFAIVMTLYGTAVRVSEFAALDTDDVLVSERKGECQVRHGKGGRHRTVGIPPDNRAALRSWLQVRRQHIDSPLGPLFVSNRGTRISTRRVQSLLATIGEETNTDLHPHALRHTFARKFLENGGDVGQLREILGHASLATTQVYVNSRRSALVASSDRVSIDF